MKVLIVLLPLTIGLGAAMECYECDNEASGSNCGVVVPGGSLNDPKRSCSNLCHIKSVNGRIHQRSCSDLEDFPDDYEAVSGDSTKRCKRSRADSIKDCLCDSDLCNVNTMAAPSNTAIPSTIASITLILTSLLLTKEVLM